MKWLVQLFCSELEHFERTELCDLHQSGLFGMCNKKEAKKEQKKMICKVGGSDLGHSVPFVWMNGVDRLRIVEYNFK